LFRLPCILLLIPHIATDPNPPLPFSSLIHILTLTLTLTLIPLLAAQSALSFFLFLFLSSSCPHTNPNTNPSIDTTKWYRVPGAAGRVGFITSMSRYCIVLYYTVLYCTVYCTVCVHLVGVSVLYPTCCIAQQSIL
jgi:hypothetical protein